MSFLLLCVLHIRDYYFDRYDETICNSPYHHKLKNRQMITCTEFINNSFTFVTKVLLNERRHTLLYGWCGVEKRLLDGWLDKTLVLFLFIFIFVDSLYMKKKR